MLKDGFNNPARTCLKIDVSDAKFDSSPISWPDAFTLHVHRHTFPWSNLKNVYIFENIIKILIQCNKAFLDIPILTSFINSSK